MALLLVVGAYLLGSVPFGVLLARRAGVDVRRAGSGNIGATNVARTAGLRLGVVTLVADVAKGALAVGAARALSDDPALAAATGVAVFLGHVFPATLRFAGGKGVATGLGVVLALSPGAAAGAVAVFVVALGSTGYVSVASMVAALAMPPLLALVGAPGPAIVGGTVMALVIVARHRDNVRRLLTGTEPRARLLKRQAPPVN